MKKHAYLLLISLLVLLPMLSFSVMADEAVVYIGGPEDSYGDLAAAAAALPAEGGTIVVRGPLEHSTSAAVTLPAKKITVTSVYGGVDYAVTNGAYFGLGRTLLMQGDLTFENITIKMTATGVYGNIYAQGNILSVGNGVTTVANASTSKFPSLFGGFSSSDNGSGFAPVVKVKSGTWSNVYGGSYDGTLNADTTVIMNGGKVEGVLGGGSRNGKQTGNTKVEISGGTVYCVCGGVYGVSGGSGSLSGDVEIDIHGDAKIENNVFGVSYYGNIIYNGNVDIDVYGNATLGRHIYAGCIGVAGKTNITYGDKGALVTVRENVSFIRPSDTSNVLSGGSSAGTVKGNVKVVVKDNVYFPGNVYAAGYSGSVNGNSTAEIYGGEVRVNFTAASRSGKVTGTATTLAYGGKIGYFSTTEPYGLLGNNTGSVGNAVVVLDGADVAGKVALNKANGTITLKSGNASYCADKCNIDLSAGKTLAIGGELKVSELIGGGTLRIPASATVNADKLSGDIELKIDGEPVGNQVYVTVKNMAGKLNYTAVDDEVLNEKVNGASVTYTLAYGNRFDTTKVRIYYYNPLEEGEQPSAVLRKGVYTGGTVVNTQKGNADGKNYIEADLTPGLYGCKVYYGSGSDDYRIKYFYVSGKEASREYDVPLEPYKQNSWSENIISNFTDEVMKLFGTDDLIGFEGFDTPSFSLENSVRNFMNNDQLCEYVDNLGKKCDYLYVFYPFKESAMGNRTPVMIFTNDNIKGMSFDEAADHIRSKGQREIVMITGNKHGNEPAGAEGALVFSKDLCGDYGKQVLEKIGAIIVMPSVEVDNAQRFKRLTESGVNPNRDLVSLFLESSQNQVYVYKSFMPTVTIDCHEDSGNSDVDPGDFSIENMDDICIRFASNFNSPHYYKNVLKNGTFDATEVLGNKIMMDAIARTKESGLRASVYYSGSTVPNTSATYPTVRGSYGFLVETMRIWTGTGRYARAVFGVEQALKSLINEVIELDGALAKNVYEERARVASITDYDPEHVFAGKHASSGISKVIGDRPTIYVSGIWKNKEGTKTFNLTDTLSDMITLPTAYVLSADVSGIEDILRVLDLHGIPYTKLKEGAKLTLRKYSGGYENTAIGEAAEVTFEKGAYAVTMNNSDAYLIAYLFEPNSHRFANAEDHSISFATVRYIKDGDGLYRSEQNGVYQLIAELSDAPAVAEPVTEPITSEPVTDEPKTEAPATDVPDTNEPAASEQNGNGYIVIAAIAAAVVCIGVAVIFIAKRKK